MLLVSFFIAIVFLVIFIWSVQNGEFDDLEGPSARIFSKKLNKNQDP